MTTDTNVAFPHRRGHRTYRRGPIALRVNVRVLGWTLLAVAGLLMLAAWALSLGDFPVPIRAVASSVLGSGTGEYNFIIRTLRLPRVLCAMLVGAALGTSGALFQGLIRNPLVSPDIIGINAGAALGGVYWIVAGRDAALMPAIAFVGALLTAAGIYFLTWKRGVTGNRLVLVGIGVSAVLQAGTTFLMTRARIQEAAAAQVWITGTVYNTDWADVRLLLVGLLILVPAATALTWPLRLLQLGDDVAASAGLYPETLRLALLFIGSALAAIAVAVAGPVGFVALITPHIARMAAGPLSAAVLLFTAVIGAAIVLGSDILGQHFFPVSLPVGVVTAVVGAPYFLVLLYRTNARM